MDEQDQLQEGSTMKSASPNQPQGLVPSRDAGRALDALIAEKVMGLPLAADARVSRGGTVDPYFRDDDADARESWYPNGMRCRRVPRYSTDMGAAWLVVERAQTLHPGWRFSLLGGDVSFGYKPRPRGVHDYVVDKSRREAFGWRASFFGDEDPTENYGQRHADEWADTAALAICRAALVAVEKTDAR